MKPYDIVLFGIFFIVLAMHVSCENLETRKLVRDCSENLKLTTPPTK